MTFLPFGKKVEIGDKPTVLEVALSGGIPINHSCGGMGSCGTCRVEVDRGLEKLSPRNTAESEMAEMRGFSENERLACQIRPVHGLSVIVPPVDSE